MVSVLKKNLFSGLFGLSSGCHGTAVASDRQILRTASDSARAPKQLRQRLSWVQPADWLRAVRWNSDNIQTLPALPALLPAEPSGSHCLRFLLYNPPPPTTEVRLKPWIYLLWEGMMFVFWNNCIACITNGRGLVLPQKTPTQTGKTNTKLSHICTCAGSPYHLCMTPANI